MAIQVIKACREDIEKWKGHTVMEGQRATKETEGRRRDRGLLRKQRAYRKDRGR
jgi:hypothetical protein